MDREQCIYFKENDGMCDPCRECVSKCGGTCLECEAYYVADCGYYRCAEYCPCDTCKEGIEYDD